MNHLQDTCQLWHLLHLKRCSHYDQQYQHGQNARLSENGRHLCGPQTYLQLAVPAHIDLEIFIVLAVSLMRPCDPEVGTITCLGRCIPWLASTVMGTNAIYPSV
jgi:hypothetical protein